MAFLFKQIRFKFYELIPLILLFIISLNGISVIDLKFISINVHFILIYYLNFIFTYLPERLKSE